jgi:hypothetical protein
MKQTVTLKFFQNDTSFSTEKILEDRGIILDAATYNIAGDDFIIMSAIQRSTIFALRRHKSIWPERLPHEVQDLQGATQHFDKSSGWNGSLSRSTY